MSRLYIKFRGGFRMKKMILLIVLVLNSIQAVAQINKIDCDSVFNSYSKIWEGKIGVTLFEKAPELIGSNEQLIVNLKKERLVDDKRVFVHFIVDKDGNPRCIEPIKDGSGFFKETAVKRVEKLKFSPAILKGKPLMVPMVLPITFKIDSSAEDSCKKGF